MSKLILAIVFMFVLTGLGMVRPYLAKLLIDDAIIGGQYELVPRLALATLGIAVLRGLFSFAQYYLKESFGQATVYDIRNALYSKLQSLPWSFYDEAQTGQLMSRVTGDVEGIRVFLSRGIVSYCDFIFIVTDALFILFYTNWKLTIVALAFLPFLGHAVLSFDRKVRPAYSATREEMAKLTSFLQENVTGVRVVKAFAQEPGEIQSFAGRNDSVRQRRLYSSRIWAESFPYMGLLSNISSVLVLWYGGYLVAKGELTVGGLVAFNSYVWTLIWPVRDLGWLTNLLEQALAAGERVYELLDWGSRIHNPPDAVVLEDFRGHVEFCEVDFAYPGRPSVLSGINLSAPPNTIVGILGATGSGKSSLVNLIGRFYDTTRGQVLVDGYDVRSLDLESLRAGVGYVPQETFLFSASIRENIAYARPDASLEDIEKAARAASAHNFIVELPEGYDTVVGERGVGLSGGQKQRVAIARAFLKNPKVLILDDATASVDMETERNIQEALSELMQGRTTFIIAHRISSVMHADEIIVLDKGKIVERGTHDRLLQDGSIYPEIYKNQFKDKDGLAELVAREEAPARSELTSRAQV